MGAFIPGLSRGAQIIILYTGENKTRQQKSKKNTHTPKRRGEKQKAKKQNKKRQKSTKIDNYYARNNTKQGKQRQKTTTIDKTRTPRNNKKTHWTRGACSWGRGRRVRRTCAPAAGGWRSCGRRSRWRVRPPRCIESVAPRQFKTSKRSKSTRRTAGPEASPSCTDYA